MESSSVTVAFLVSEMQATWVRSLSWEDPLEKGNATHSSILAWRIPGQLFPSPGDLPNPGIELGSPALQADSLPTELSG